MIETVTFFQSSYDKGLLCFKWLHKSRRGILLLLCNRKLKEKIMTIMFCFRFACIWRICR